MKLSTIPSILVSLVSLSLSVQAVPISHSNYALVHAKRQDRTQVTRQQIDDTLRRPALFSRVAYCSAESITSWNCGAPCEALGEVEVFLAGGDDGAIPGFFVAHDKTSNSIIVAHQGTERDNVLSVINNLQLRLIEPNATLFPSTVGSNIRVHEGFHATFQRTSDSILSTILTTAIPRTGATRIVSTGHSLGGAVAVFDGMMIKEAVKDLRVVPLGPDGNPVSEEGEEGGQGVEIQVETRVFGNPRTGNEEWANWIDSTLGTSFSYLTNQNDPVPRLPPSFLGYTHASNEAHIKTVDAQGQATDVVWCQGREDDTCADGNSIFRSSVSDHGGPYFDNISFGSSECPF